jgi:osmotically inducible protein OsmC
MAHRSAEAVWQGTLNEGNGSLKLSSGSYEGPYTFMSRFEEGAGTNPEEMIAAAQAGCFTMALSAALGRQGFPVTRVHTTAEVTLTKLEAGMTITKITLNTEGSVQGIDEAKFQEEAEKAKSGCIISRAMNPSIEFVLNAKLV